jgi:hypothetical protein
MFAGTVPQSSHEFGVQFIFRPVSWCKLHLDFVSGASMSFVELRRRLRTAILIALIAGGTAVAPTAFSTTSVRVAEATVLQEKDKDKDKKDDKKSQGSDDDEDHVLNGQVLEINTLKDPPELIVGSVDGQTVIRVLKTDEIALNGVRIGDYIEAKGEKQHEQLFEATELSVSAHFTAPTEDEDKKKKN